MNLLFYKNNFIYHLRKPFTAICIALSLDRNVRLQQRQNYHINNDKNYKNKKFYKKMLTKNATKRIHKCNSCRLFFLEPEAQMQEREPFGHFLVLFLQFKKMYIKHLGYLIHQVIKKSTYDMDNLQVFINNNLPCM